MELERESTIILIPAHNEWENLSKWLSEIFIRFELIEVLIIATDSPNFDWWNNLRWNYPEQLHITIEDNPKGIGKALRSGFQWAFKKSYQRIIQMDADGAHDIEYIHSLIDSLNLADFVIGSRLISKDGLLMMSPLRKGLSKFANFLIKSSLGLKQNDCTSGLRAFNNQSLLQDSVNKTFANGHIFQMELLAIFAKRSSSIMEVPFKMGRRLTGRSNIRLKTFIESFQVLIRLSFFQKGV